MHRWLTIILKLCCRIVFRFVLPLVKLCRWRWSAGPEVQSKSAASSMFSMTSPVLEPGAGSGASSTTMHFSFGKIPITRDPRYYPPSSRIDGQINKLISLDECQPFINSFNVYLSLWKDYSRWFIFAGSIQSNQSDGMCNRICRGSFLWRLCPILFFPALLDASTSKDG